MFRRPTWTLFSGYLCILGCAARLPTYDWVDARNALATMAERDGEIQTISARCRVVLTKPDRSSVQFDAALAARLPDHVRIRAWKMGQTVFDLTLTPEGLWVLDEHAASRSSVVPSAGLTADRLTQAWRLLIGGFAQSDWEADALDDGSTFRVRRTLGGDGSIVATIDRSTLTIQEFQVFDRDLRLRQRLTLGRCCRVDGHIWPTKFTAEGDEGAITLWMDDMEINEELPRSAFDPPRRAVKQP